MVTQVYSLSENTLRPTLIICMLFCMCIMYINKNCALKSKIPAYRASSKKQAQNETKQESPFLFLSDNKG